MATAQDLISFALRAAGVLGVGQTALAEDNADAFTTLNGMIALWNRKRWLMFHTTDNALQSTGALSYTVGVGGDFNVTRPSRLEKAFFRQYVSNTPNAVDYPLIILEAREDYDNIALKTLNSWPTHIFYDAAWPLGKVYPWPVPQAGIYELHLTLRDQFDAFTTYVQVIDLPPEYWEAMWSNLVLRLAPIYGFTVSTDIRLLAADSLSSIRAANAQIPKLHMPRSLRQFSRYNIFSDRNY